MNEECVVYVCFLLCVFSVNCNWLILTSCNCSKKGLLTTGCGKRLSNLKIYNVSNYVLEIVPYFIYIAFNIAVLITDCIACSQAYNIGRMIRPWSWSKSSKFSYFKTLGRGCHVCTIQQIHPVTLTNWRPYQYRWYETILIIVNNV